MYRIAIEEAFATKEIINEWRKILGSKSYSKDPAFDSIYRPLLNSSKFQNLRERLIDLNDYRIAEMDKHGINIQLLSLTAPGVQILNNDKARIFTLETNTYLAEIINQHPERFYGLITISPNDPEFSVNEIQRMRNQNNMVGIIINSHTCGHYLDDKKYFPIFAVAQELNLPIYLHPNTPSAGMAEPFLKYGLEGPLWGFAVETGLHALRLILSGLFDRYSGLKIILGHMGEGLPFWLSRIQNRISISELFDKTGSVSKLQKNPRDYIESNFYFSTSGMNYCPVVRYVCEVCGISKVMFAIDYPYESTEEAVNGIENSTLSIEDKKKIFFQNAQEVFNYRFKLKFGNCQNWLFE